MPSIDSLFRGLSFGGQQIVGLDIGSRFLKALQVKETSKGFVVERFGILPIEPELIVDGSILDSLRVVEGIKTLFRQMGTKTKNVTLSVSGHSSVIIKRITLPEMTEEELQESIRFEAEQYIPFDIDDVNLDFHILGSTETAGQMEVLLVAVKKDKINEYVSVVQEAGLIPQIVDVDAFALENAYEINYDIEPEQNVALINVGASRINLNILKGGVSVFTRDSSIGSNIQTEAIQKELGLTYDEAERLKRGGQVDGVAQEEADAIIQSSSDDIINEITRSLDYFKGTFMHENVHRAMISGGCSLIKGFVPRLTEMTGVEVEVLNPFANIEIDKAVEKELIREAAPQMVVALGLAVRRIGDR